VTIVAHSRDPLARSADASPRWRRTRIASMRTAPRSPTTSSRSARAVSPRQPQADQANGRDKRRAERPGNRRQRSSTADGFSPAPATVRNPPISVRTISGPPATPRSPRRAGPVNPGRCRERDPPPPTFGLRVAVLSRRHPGQDHFAGLNSEALAREVLLIKDPGHFAIDSGRL
jgi:hypothetical protein